MKICIVSHEFITHSGQGRVNYEIAHYLAQQNHEIYLIATEIAPNLQLYSNIHHLSVQIPHWVKTELLRNQLFALSSRSILKQHTFDIIHANGSITYFPSDINACHFVHSSWLKSDYHPSHNRLSLNSFYQWLYTQLNANWEQRAYLKTKRAIAVSIFVKQSLIKDAHIPAETIDVVWNGVDIEEFRPLGPDEDNVLRSSLGLGPETCISFFTGDIKSNRKNLDLVLQALAELPIHHCLVVAGATAGSPYPEMAKGMGLSDRVHFLGHRSDISTLLRCADIFTFPSHYDPCPLVILEALASGLPVVTTRSVGNSALIQSGKNGYILNGNYDLDGLVRILGELSESAELRSRIGKMGRQTAELRSWRNMAKQYEAIYAAELRRRRALEVCPDNYLIVRSLE